MSDTYCSALFHYIFSTKNRINLLEDDMRDRVWVYMGGIAEHHGMKALKINGTANHCHVLLSIPTTIALCDAIKKLKGSSSRWINETFPNRGHFDWQKGYGAFSIGLSQVRSTIAYIENQQAHHLKISFEDEFSQALEKHRIPYDKRFLFY